MRYQQICDFQLNDNMKLCDLPKCSLGGYISEGVWPILTKFIGLLHTASLLLKPQNYVRVAYNLHLN